MFLQTQTQTGENIKMITDEVSQIQEVSPHRFRTFTQLVSNNGGVNVKFRLHHMAASHLSDFYLNAKFVLVRR